MDTMETEYSAFDQAEINAQQRQMDEEGQAELPALGFAPGSMFSMESWKGREHGYTLFASTPDYDGRALVGSAWIKQDAEFIAVAVNAHETLAKACDDALTLAFKHESQSWRDAHGTDAEKLARITGIMREALEALRNWKSKA